MVKLKKDLNEELDKVLDGINLIDSIKSTMRSDLSKYIQSDKVEQILNKEANIDILDEKELRVFLKKIFNFTRDENFNPAIVIEQEKDNYTQVELYNQRFKEKFLSKYSENTQRVNRVLFGRIAKLEQELGKDLYDFEYEDIEEVLYALRATTHRSLQNSISTIEQYISYAMRQKKTRNKINYATAFDKRTRIDKFLDKDAEENMIFDKAELFEMAMYADNAQDGAILGLIFDGISHKNEFEELVELTIDDCNLEEQEINIETREEPIPISTETKTLIKDAYEQETYISITGENVRRYKIADSKHILRGLRGNSKIKWRNVNQRILRIANIFDEKYLNATNIAYSGQIHLAKQLLDKGMDMEQVIDKVLTRFGVTINSSSRFYLRKRIEKYLEKAS